MSAEKAHCKSCKVRVCGTVVSVLDCAVGGACGIGCDEGVGVGGMVGGIGACVLPSDVQSPQVSSSSSDCGSGGCCGCGCVQCIGSNCRNWSVELVGSCCVLTCMWDIIMRDCSEGTVEMSLSVERGSV